MRAQTDIVCLEANNTQQRDLSGVVRWRTAMQRK